MSDAPSRPRRPDQPRIPKVYPVGRAPQSAPVPRRSPLWPWLIAGGVVFVGLMALVVGVALLFVARSERQAHDRYDDALSKISGTSPVSTPVLGPQPDPQPQRQPPAPPKPKFDPDYFNDKVPDPPAGPATVRGEYRVDMDEVGNAKVELDMKSQAEWMAQMRERLSMYLVPGPDGSRYRPPNVKNLLRVIQDDYALMEDVDGELTDHAIRITYREIGVAKYRDGRWIRDLQPDPEYPMKLVKKERSQVVTLRSVKALPGNFTAVTNVVVKLPPGAHDIEVTEKPNQLWYRLPKPAPRAPTAEAKTSFAVQTKPHLLGALAKQYAESRQENLWAARSIFRNDSVNTFTNYRARCRIPDFAGWSDWQVCDRVFPGQTVVDVFRPKLDHAKIAALIDPAEIEIEAECEFTGPDGLVRQSSREPTRILPINQGVFSDVEINADMTWLEHYKFSQRILASFVVPNDPVMKEVVDLVCRSTGVARPIKTDKDALAFVKGVYLLMRGNMKWEPAQSGVVQGMPYQRLKYGRDVLRDHAGTCVNTSIFFASVMEAAGLDPLLYVIPGHCFAGVLMPEGKPGGTTAFLVIETTGCGEGTMQASAPFDVVLAKANETIQKALQNKMYMEVHVRFMRKEGVVPPELPVIKGDVLADWGVRMPKEDEAGEARAGGAGLTDVRATVKVLRQEANVTRNGKRGAVVHMAVNITKAKNRTCEVLSGFIDEDGKLVKARGGESADPDHLLVVKTSLKPDSDDANFADVQLFVPYDALPAGAGKKYVGVALVSSDGRALSKPDRGAVFVVVR